MIETCSSHPRELFVTRLSLSLAPPHSGEGWFGKLLGKAFPRVYFWGLESVKLTTSRQSLSRCVAKQTGSLKTKGLHFLRQIYLSSLPIPSSRSVFLFDVLTRARLRKDNSLLGIVISSLVMSEHFLPIWALDCNGKVPQAFHRASDVAQ